MVSSKELKQINKNDIIILYFHGNAGNVRIRWNHLLELKNIISNCSKKNVVMISFDYKGFGKSKGSLSSDSLLKDGYMISYFLRLNFRNNKIIYYGESIGTSVASFVSTKIKPNLLILKSPFYNMASMANIIYKIPNFISNIVINNDYNTVNYLKEINDLNIIIGHSKNDSLIPYENAYLLKPFVTKFIDLDGDHNDYDFGDKWINGICDFI